MRDIVRMIVVLAVLLMTCEKREPSKDISPDKNTISRKTETVTVDSSLAANYFSIAKKIASAAKYDSAMTLYKKASDLYKEDKNWEKYVACYNNMGELTWRHFSADTAAKYLNHALDIGMKKLGAQHPEIAMSYDNIGITKEIKGHFNQALELYNKALKIRLLSIRQIQQR